jgi:hypothetical protein
VTLRSSRCHFSATLLGREFRILFNRTASHGRSGIAGVSDPSFPGRLEFLADVSAGGLAGVPEVSLKMTTISS